MDTPKIVHVVMEVRTDPEGIDHVVVVGVFEHDSMIPSSEKSAKLYGPACARNIVQVFLNENQGAPCFGIGPHKRHSRRQGGGAG